MMKHIVKNIFLMVLITACVMSSQLTAQAAESNSVPPSDYGDPISSTSYEDEDGCQITEEIYFCPDSSKSRAKSGSGWYKNVKTKTWSSGTTTTYYAQGYFVWGNGTVSVSSPSGKISNVPSSVKISGKTTKSGTGKYAYVLNDYAYVTFSCTATNAVGLETDLSVTIRVSESGNTI